MIESLTSSFIMETSVQLVIFPAIRKKRFLSKRFFFLQKQVSNIFLKKNKKFTHLRFQARAQYQVRILYKDWLCPASLMKTQTSLLNQWANFPGFSKIISIWRILQNLLWLNQTHQGIEDKFLEAKAHETIKPVYNNVKDQHCRNFLLSCITDLK